MYMEQQKNIDFTQMPYNFALCLLEDCPLAENCLRQLAYKYHSANEEIIKAVNPAAVKGQKCKHFASAEPIKYAKGFLKVLDDFPAKKLRQLTYHLRGAYGDYVYYRYRRGEYLIPPESQKHITSVARNLGLEFQEFFDAYVYRTGWK